MQKSKNVQKTLIWNYWFQHNNSNQSGVSWTSTKLHIIM